MRKVDLRPMEEMKYKIIKQLVDNKGNKNAAAIKLGVTIRTINRMINGYEEFGKEFFMHGNRNKKPDISINDATKEYILNLYNEIYHDFNFNHFKDKLLEDYNIKVSYNFIYSLLTKNLILSPKAQRKTRKKHRDRIQTKINLNEKLTLKDQQLIVENNILDPKDNHARIPRSKYAGELIQMDASEHIWFGNSKVHLHAAICNATGEWVAGYFDYQETLNGYYNVSYQVLKSKGIPYEFLTDKRTVFEYKLLKNPQPEYDTLTQFGYACEQLGIKLTTTSVPQAKGRIERLFGTLQSRLINDMRVNGISTIEQANEFLKTYITKYNKKFSLTYNIPHVYEKINDDVDLNLILARVSTRLVDNGSSIKYKNSYYQLYDKNGLLVNVKNKVKVTIIEAFDKQLFANLNGNYYKLFKLDTHYKISKELDLLDKNKTKENKRKYIPPMSHPLKERSYQAYLKRKEYYSR